MTEDDLCFGLTDEECDRICPGCLTTDAVWLIADDPDDPYYLCTQCASVWRKEGS
jgi:hypothetical protein